MDPTAFTTAGTKPIDPRVVPECPPASPALSNNYVRSHRGGLYGLCEGLHLADQFRASVLDDASVGSWFSERDHHRRRLRDKSNVEWLWILMECLGNEADRNTDLACCREFLLYHRA